MNSHFTLMFTFSGLLLMVVTLSMMVSSLTSENFKLKGEIKRLRKMINVDKK